MHELSVCQALLGQVEAIAREHAARVERIRLRIGPLSGVDRGLLDRAFTLARAGTVAETAELSITEAEVRVRCRDCGAESAASVNRLLCGACGGWRTELAGGDELLLLSVELSEDERVATDAA